MLVRAYSSQSCLCRWSRAAPADLSGPVWLTACSWITAGEDCPLGRIEPSVPLTFSVIFRQVRRTGGGRQWQMPSGVGARVDRPARKNKRGRIDKMQNAHSCVYERRTERNRGMEADRRGFQGLARWSSRSGDESLKELSFLKGHCVVLWKKFK